MSMTDEQKAICDALHEALAKAIEPFVGPKKVMAFTLHFLIDLGEGAHMPSALDYGYNEEWLQALAHFMANRDVWGKQPTAVIDVDRTKFDG